MKRLAVCSLLLIMLVLTGCPVLTKNSPDAGSYEVPSWLPGKWQETDMSGKTHDSYYLEKDKGTGRLKYYETNSEGKINRTAGKPAILSAAGGKIFMSVYTPGDDMTEEGYYIFEFRKVNNTTFVLAAIKEHNIDYDATQADIIKYLQDNKDNDDIYDPAETTTYKKQ